MMQDNLVAFIMQASDDEDHSPDSVDLAEDNGDRAQWYFLGSSIPKNQIIFFVQVIVLYVVILTSIVNLSLAHGDSNLWTALLSSSLGYLLPNPTLKREKRNEDDH